MYIVHTECTWLILGDIYIAGVQTRVTIWIQRCESLAEDRDVEKMHKLDFGFKFPAFCGQLCPRQGFRGVDGCAANHLSCPQLQPAPIHHPPCNTLLNLTHCIASTILHFAFCILSAAAACSNPPSATLCIASTLLHFHPLLYIIMLKCAIIWYCTVVPLKCPPADCAWPQSF